MAKYKQNAFAQFLGLTKSAISKAVKDGRLVLNESKRIDDKNPLTIIYMNSQLSKKKKEFKRDIDKQKLSEIEREKADKLKKIVPPEESKIIDDIAEIAPGVIGPMLETAEKMIKQKSSPKKPKSPTYDDPGLGDDEYNSEAHFLDANLEHHKIQKMKADTEKQKIAIARELGQLIPRQMFERAMGNVAAVNLNHFFPMGTRLTPIVCGECGVTDPEILARVQKIIDTEITRALSQVKEKVKMKHYKIEGGE